MDTKDTLFQLRTQRGLSQDELAEKIFVTRQAVSRWEQGTALPDAGNLRKLRQRFGVSVDWLLEDAKGWETLKLLSQFFDVSINTLLGAPRQLVCQCCGMPLEDSTLSRETDGSFNEDYCKWCYTGGEFKYSSPEQLIDFCVAYMASEQWPPEQVRAHMEAVVPQLKHWKK